jgi:hypothetical protein
LLNIVPFVCSFARRTMTSSTTLKRRVDNTSPCLSPWRVSKYSIKHQVDLKNAWSLHFSSLALFEF